jgi:hypothetical protein
MFGTKRHLRVGLIAVILLFLGVGPLQAYAAVTTTTLTVAETPKLMITELQTSGSSASEEFVELYNASDEDVDLADIANGGKDVWKVQFFSSTNTTTGSPDWTKPATTIALTGVIPAHDYFILASTDYAPGGFSADQSMSSRLSDTGGGVQVVQVSGTASLAHNRLMWKKPTTGEVLPSSLWPTPPSHGSLQRLPNEDDGYVGLDGALTNFVTSETISPYDKWIAPVPDPVVVEVPEDPNTTTENYPESDQGNATDPTNPEISPEMNEGLLPPQITELMPNPAAPLKDEADEYIEVYNPNNSPFNLKNYALEVGTTALHDHTFSDDTILPANGYVAFYSKDTRLSLTNTGSRARLLHPDESIVSESDAYGTAAEGQAWMVENKIWQWTTTATPAVANVLTAPVVAAKTAKTTTAKAATAKKATTKTSKPKAAAKPKVKKAAKAKTAKKKKATKTNLATVASISQKPPRTPIHPRILVGVIIAAVLYAAYEYRHDVSNQLRKLRGNRDSRQYART